MVVKIPNNLFNPYTVMHDKELGDSGVLLDKSDWFVSDYINVSELSSVVISGKSQGQTNAFFNANKQFISQTLIAEGTVSVPSGAVYLRINAPITLLNTTAVTSKIPYIAQVTDLYVKQQTTKRVRATVSRPAGSTENKINYFNCGPTIKNIDNYDPNASYPNGIEYELFTDSIDGIVLNTVKPLLSAVQPFKYKSYVPARCWGYCISTRLKVSATTYAAYVALLYEESASSALCGLRITVENTAPGKTDAYIYRIDWSNNATQENIRQDNFGTAIGSGGIYCGTYDVNNMAYVYIYKPTIQSGNYVWIDVVIARTENGVTKYYSDPRNGHTKLSLTEYPQLNVLFNNNTHISIDSGESYPRIFTAYSSNQRSYAICWTPTYYSKGTPFTISDSATLPAEQNYYEYSFTPESSAFNPIVTDITVYDGSFNHIDTSVSWTYNQSTNKIDVYIALWTTDTVTIRFFISYISSITVEPTRNTHTKSITVSISGGRGSAVFTPEGSDIEIESATAPGVIGVNVSATYNKTTNQIRVDVTNAAGSSTVDCEVKYTSI